MNINILLLMGFSISIPFFIFCIYCLIKEAKEDIRVKRIRFHRKDLFEYDFHTEMEKQAKEVEKIKNDEIENFLKGFKSN